MSRTAPKEQQSPASRRDISPAVSPAEVMVKTEHLSPSPPLVQLSGLIAVGEAQEKHDDIGHLRTQLQLSTFEYSALEDQFKNLQRQHVNLQDLASAYSVVIRGCNYVNGTTVSIGQLQIEAGRDGLRAKALEADLLRPLVREAGGLHALVAQMNTMRAIIDKAGGLLELERSVSDLRAIQDILHELRDAHGLARLVSEIRELLMSRQTYTDLQYEVQGPNGLRAKASKYEKLMGAFVEVEGVTSTQHPTVGHATMNPARARMISTTPLAADPHRDLYEAAAPVGKPNSKTGSNNTPLGAPQVAPVLKRDWAESNAADPPGPPGKRPRVDLGRAPALVQASLPVGFFMSTARGSSQTNSIEGKTGVAAFDTHGRPARF